MPGADGSFGVWANHRSIIAVLKAGRVEMRTGSTIRTFTIGEGFFEMDKNEATLLTDKIEGLALATDDEE
jgi:F-type H+-transporting ATPase subunit epsilon